MKLKTITSLKKARLYFLGITKDKVFDSKGVEHIRYIPPKDFYRMNVSFSDCPAITHVYYSWQWIDYFSLLTKNEVYKLIIYYKI